MPRMQLHTQYQLTRLWSRCGPSKQKAVPDAGERATSRANRRMTHISGGKETFARPDNFNVQDSLYQLVWWRLRTTGAVEHQTQARSLNMRTARELRPTRWRLNGRHCISILSWTIVRLPPLREPASPRSAWSFPSATCTTDGAKHVPFCLNGALDVSSKAI